MLPSILLLISLPIAQDSAARDLPDLTPVATYLDQWVGKERSVDGAGLIVMRDGVSLLEHAAGAHELDTVMPIASASKWLATATVLTLVDDGLVTLDDPVAKHLPQFREHGIEDLTLRHCLSCTTGWPARIPSLVLCRDMDAMMERIAAEPRMAAPGEVFRYGGVGFQIAARVAEVVTGTDWNTLFDDRIRRPLRWVDTTFEREGRRNVPWIGGGARSSAREYVRFVQMLASGGRYDGTQVLSAQMVDEMLREQIAGVEVAFTPYRDDGAHRYGLGTWIDPDRGDDGPPLVSDAGAYGFTPWIDRSRGVFGVFAVNDKLRRTYPAWIEIQLLVGRALGGERSRPQTPARRPSGDVEVELRHDGRDRSAVVHVPAALGDGPVPLVLVLHGGGGNAGHAERMSGFSDLADREGFVVAYPNGTGRLKGRLLTWNCAGLPVYAVKQDVDDVGFLRALVDEVDRRVSIDRSRVYATGMSNGGMMVHRLAREAADLFVAVADVAGAMNFDGADPSIPVSVMMVHGRADQNVRYEGGRPGKGTAGSGDRVDTSVADGAAYYVEQLGLPETPAVSRRGTVTVETFGDSDDPLGPEVMVVSIDGEGHTWPGGEAGRRAADQPTDAFDATEEIWRFFRDHPRRASDH